MFKLTSNDNPQEKASLLFEKENKNALEELRLAIDLLPYPRKKSGESELERITALHILGRMQSCLWAIAHNLNIYCHQSGLGFLENWELYGAWDVNQLDYLDIEETDSQALKELSCLSNLEEEEENKPLDAWDDETYSEFDVSAFDVSHNQSKIPKSTPKVNQASQKSDSSPKSKSKSPKPLPSKSKGSKNSAPKTPQKSKKTPKPPASNKTQNKPQNKPSSKFTSFSKREPKSIQNSNSAFGSKKITSTPQKPKSKNLQHPPPKNQNQCDKKKTSKSPKFSRKKKEVVR